jgi:hypothetical protein
MSRLYPKIRRRSIVPAIPVGQVSPMKIMEAYQKQDRDRRAYQQYRRATRNRYDDVA